jgi:hypothetical protein
MAVWDFPLRNNVSDNEVAAFLKMVKDARFQCGHLPAAPRHFKAQAYCVLGRTADGSRDARTGACLLTPYEADRAQLGLDASHGDSIVFYMNDVAAGVTDVLRPCRRADLALGFKQQHDPADASVRAYGEPHTGDAWRIAEDDLRRTGRLSDGTAMIALAGYSDKTMTRTIGSIPYWPLMLMCLNQHSNHRRQATAKVLVGYIPVLKKPAHMPQKKFSTLVGRVAMLCWGLTLKRLHDLEEGPPAIDVILADKSRLTGVMRLIMMVGDHPELQLLCGVSPSWNASYPCRMCMCPHSDADKFYSEAEQRALSHADDNLCELRTWRDALKQVARACIPVHSSEVLSHTLFSCMQHMAGHMLHTPKSTYTCA